MRAGRKIYQGIGIVVGASSFIGVFTLGFYSGRVSAGEFHTNVEKAAKRRLKEAADKIVREEIERRRIQRIFDNITQNQ